MEPTIKKRQRENFMEFLKTILSEETFKTLNEKLGEDLAKQVNEKLTEFKLDTGKEKFIPKAKFDEVREAEKELKAQLEERDKQLTTLNESAKGNADLQLKIKELQENNTKSQKEWQDKLIETNKKFAYKSTLDSLAKDYKPKSLEDLERFINKESLKFEQKGEEFEVAGFKEQLDALKGTKAYLFEETPAGTGSPANNPAGAPSGTMATKTGKII